jgi:hypothetical protein
VAPQSVHDVLRSPGEPLKPATRTFFETKFGHDFSQVRVHTSAHAARSAADVEAMAFTVGRNVVFGAARFAPETEAGKSLLAHELTHVVQQDQESAAPDPQLTIGPVDDVFEFEADRVADAVNKNAPIVFSATDEPIHTLRRACGPAAIGSVSGCIGLGGQDIADVGLSSADHFAFKVGCNDMRPGEEARLRDRARSIAPDETVEIHGFASEEGDVTFNDDLSCAGARVANSVLLRESVTAPITLYKHGATSGGRDDRRSAVLSIRTGAAAPENCSSLIDDCEFYRCRERRHQCGAHGYYLGYGHKYCERFGRLRLGMQPSGQRWIDETRRCLMRYIDKRIQLDAPCDDVRRLAFDSHPDCYVFGGVCFLEPQEWQQILGAIDVEDNDLKQILITGIDCLGNWMPLAFPTHGLGAGGGYRGLMERDRRRNFGF